MSRETLLAALSAVLASVGGSACDGQPAVSGVGEPIQVPGGQFIRGDLPGTAPPVAASGEGADAAPPAPGPQVTNTTLDSTGAVALPGAAGKSISGRTSGAVAVGARFADLGTGYWVVPVAEADSMFPGENAFRFSANFDANDPPGFHNLRIVAIDASGRAGTQADLPLCLAGRIPDNLHACSPGAPPPAAIISLQWDTNFDVDLHVVAPGGLDFSPKRPFGELVDSGGAPDPKLPHIDRDSLAGCTPDGLRQEDLVFQDPPPHGTYFVYADPFAPCGQSSVRFQLSVYQVAGTCPNCALEETFPPRRGELLGIQVTGGVSSGRFVYQFGL